MHNKNHFTLPHYTTTLHLILAQLAQDREEEKDKQKQK